MGAVVTKYARPRKTPTHVHTLVMTTTDTAAVKKVGIFDPDVVTSLRRHTDSLDVLPRTACVQKSTLTQTPGQKQALIQTHAHGQTVTKAYVHKQANKQPSISSGFCIRRQDSTFSESDSDDSDESDSDSTFTDLTAAGRAAAHVPPPECRSNSFPRTIQKNLHRLSTSFDSQLYCCQETQLLSSSEGKLQQVSCIQPPPSSTSARELRQVISSTGQLQHLITASGELQHLTSRGAIHHLTSTTGTLQHLTSNSKELKHLKTPSPKLQHHISPIQEPQYTRSSSLDGLHTFVFSEDLQRFLTSRELYQISYSENRFPLGPSTTMWQSINSSGSFLPMQVHSNHPSAPIKTLSTTQCVQPLSSTLDIEPSTSFRGVRQTVSHINLNPLPGGKDLHSPSAFRKVQPNHMQRECIPATFSGKLPKASHDLHSLNLSLQNSPLDEPFPCGELLPPPSFREPHQKSPTEERTVIRTPDMLQPFTLLSTLPHSTSGPIQQSASFYGFNQQIPMSIELQSFHASKSVNPVLNTETSLINARVASSSSCGELNLKSAMYENMTSQVHKASSNLICEPSEKFQKLLESPKEIEKGLPASILRSPKSIPKSTNLNQSGNKILSVPRPLTNKLNKPTVRFCDDLVTEGAKSKYTVTSSANESNESSSKTKQVSFAEIEGNDSVLVRKNDKSNAVKSSAKRCGQLFLSDERSFLNNLDYGETENENQDEQLPKFPLEPIITNDKSEREFVTTDEAKTNRRDPSTPTKPPRGMYTTHYFDAENNQTLFKPSAVHNFKDNDDVSLDFEKNVTSS